MHQFNESVNTQFATLAHTPMVEREHHPALDMEVAHILYLQHWDSIGVDLCDTPPTAKTAAQATIINP